MSIRRLTRARADDGAGFTPGRGPRRFVVLALVVGLIVLARALPSGPAAHDLGAAMALGALLLGGYYAGWLMGQTRLPKLTGFIAFGLLAGPQVSNLLEGPVVDALGPIDGMAVALIALEAGAELRLSWLKQHLLKTAVISALTTLMVTGLVASLLFAARDTIPFLQKISPTAGLGVAALVGITMAARSPLVILAVNSESRARGPLSDTLLGVAIMMDLLVVVGAGVFMAVTRRQLAGGEAGFTAVALDLAIHIGGSILLGVLIGGALAAYVRFVGKELALVIAGLSLAISEVGGEVGLEPLLMAITAGAVFINTAGARSRPFVRALARVSLPVYALFFGLIGANLDLSLLASLGLLGGLLVLARVVSIWAATSLGAHLAGAEPEVRRYAWLGFVSQAGITLGIAVTIARTFPGFGGEVQNLLVGVVAVNTLVGPVLQRVALEKAGEVGADGPGEAVAATS